MAVLCGMPTIYSIRLEELGISALAAYFRHSTRPSVTWLNSRSSLAACDPLMSALSAVPSTRVRRRRKFGDVSCTECRPTGQGNDSELIPTVKMETSYGNEFSPIYDHCGVMAAWNRKTLKKKFNFLRFWKTTHYGKIFKILFRNDSSRHQSTYCVQILWNLTDRKSVKLCDDC